MSFRKLPIILSLILVSLGIDNCNNGPSSSSSAPSSASTPLMQSSNTASAIPQQAPGDVLTFHNDNARTGQNLFETVLKPTNVNQFDFGKLAFFPADGKVDAQPLVVSNLLIGGVPHTAVFVATEHDSVYAYDSRTGALLWKTSLLGTGESPSDTHGCGAVVPEIGISSTPVIDRTIGVIYVVAMSSTSPGNDIHRLHALSLSTGAEMLGGPITISAVYSGPQMPEKTFVASQYKERAALLLANGKIYTSWSSHCDSSPYSSWVIAFDASTLQMSHVFNAEPSGDQGGYGAFWNSGYGPAADANGNVYLMTANGYFDTNFDANGFPMNQDYGNAFIKLAPPAPGASTLTLTDYFTMHDTAEETASDEDLGSGGGMLLPDMVDSSGQVRHLIVGAGKDCNIYLLDRDNLGKFRPDSDIQAWQKIDGAFPSNADNPPAGVFGGPAYFNHLVYFGAVGDSLRAFPISQARLSASGSMKTTHPFPYPGVTPSISANGTLNGIVWVVVNSPTRGTLQAYDANSLVLLYSGGGPSDAFGGGSRSTPPTIANGRVYVATQVDFTNVLTGTQNGVAMFGLRRSFP
jgi:outer membrane protein assembly factor BamB